MTPDRPAEVGAFLVALMRVGAIAMTAPVIGDSGVPVRAKPRVLSSPSRSRSPRTVPASTLDDAARDRARSSSASGIITGLTARFVMARARDRRPAHGPRARPRLRVGVRRPRRRERRRDAHDVRRRSAASRSSRAHGLEAIVRGVAHADLRRSPCSAGMPSCCATAPRRSATGSRSPRRSCSPPLVGNVGLAVMNRAAPAMNVFSVALSAVLARRVLLDERRRSAGDQRPLA